jgi:hypothetical protein
VINPAAPLPVRRFKSARLVGEYEKPWVGEVIPKKKFEPWILWGCVMFGIAIGGVICWLSYTSVSNYSYCLVFEDDFKTIDKDVWGYEIQRGGFG